jgi:transposase-like protein
MQQKIVKRYSVCFKRQVVEDLESGRFDTMGEAQQHYGITGNATVQRWLRQYGKNHLVPKVIRVQKPNEKDQIRQLKQQIAQLQQALGQTQAENVVNKEFLKIACEDLGCDVDTFKKKAVIAPSARAAKKRD